MRPCLFGWSTRSLSLSCPPVTRGCDKVRGRMSAKARRSHCHPRSDPTPDLGRRAGLLVKSREQRPVPTLATGTAPSWLDWPFNVDGNEFQEASAKETPPLPWPRAWPACLPGAGDRSSSGVQKLSPFPRDGKDGVGVGRRPQRRVASPVTNGAPPHMASVIGRHRAGPFRPAGSCSCPWGPRQTCRTLHQQALCAAPGGDLTSATGNAWSQGMSQHPSCTAELSIAQVISGRRVARTERPHRAAWPQCSGWRLADLETDQELQ
jgi:hypothetical protein